MIEEYGGIKNFYHAMLGHHVDSTDSTVISLAQSLFHLRQTIPERVSLQSFISSSGHNLSELFPPHLARAASRLARVFDGGRLTEGTTRWQRTFDVFLLNSFSKSPFSRTEPLLDQARLYLTTCLEIMAKELHFDMFKHTSSFRRNSEAQNLMGPAHSSISAYLSYACRHWTNLVSELEILDGDLVRTLSEFFQTHFLHWLEVMSILGFSPAEALTNLDVVRVCNLMILSTTSLISIHQY